MKIILFLYIFSSTILLFSADNISVMSYNLWNYFVIEGPRSKVKSESSKEALVQVIKAADPDIMLVSEIGGEPALNDLLAHLKKVGLNYKFSTVMYGADRTRHIGCIAKFKPKYVRKNYDKTYNIKSKKSGEMDKVYVQRGFLHILFDIDGYKLNIVNAHFKSRLPHYLYSQTDMRRSEARLLKYYVNGIIKKYPEANILVTGDLNDICGSSPLITLRGMERKEKNRLYDLKPIDSEGASWTHWWKTHDSYGRIDYFLVSPSLLSEIVFDKLTIPHISKYALKASDHRPLIMEIKTKDRDNWSQKQITENFINGIRKDK